MVVAFDEGKLGCKIGTQQQRSVATCILVVGRFVHQKCCAIIDLFGKQLGSKDVECLGPHAATAHAVHETIVGMDAGSQRRCQVSRKGPSKMTLPLMMNVMVLTFRCSLSRRSYWPVRCSDDGHCRLLLAWLAPLEVVDGGPADNTRAKESLVAFREKVEYYTSDLKRQILIAVMTASWWVVFGCVGFLLA